MANHHCRTKGGPGYAIAQVQPSRRLVHNLLTRYVLNAHSLLCANQNSKIIVASYGVHDDCTQTVHPSQYAPKPAAGPQVTNRPQI